MLPCNRLNMTPLYQERKKSKKNHKKALTCPATLCILHPTTTTKKTMTTIQKMRMLFGKSAKRYDKRTGKFLENVNVRTMDDAWEICCGKLHVENGFLIYETATLKYKFISKKLAVIAND